MLEKQCNLWLTLHQVESAQCVLMMNLILRVVGMEDVSLEEKEAEEEQY